MLANVLWQYLYGCAVVLVVLLTGKSSLVAGVGGDDIKILTVSKISPGMNLFDPEVQEIYSL